MRFSIRCVLTLAIVTGACGGGSSPTSPSPAPTPTSSGSTPTPTPTPPPSNPTPPPSSSSSLSFRVDGTQHTATSVTAGLSGGILSVGGTDSARTTTLGFALSPTPAGTGTYTFGLLNPGNALILIGNPAAGWQAGVGIGSGSITVTTFTATGAAGTFSFTMNPVQGSGATGTKSVEGNFNVTFTAPTAPSPTPSGGSTFTVSIDGTPWSSSLSRRATMTNNILSITGQDTNLRVITLAVPVSAGLMVPPSAPVTVTLDFGSPGAGVVGMVQGAQNWTNGQPGGRGSFTVTSISQTRVTGTFTVTLVNAPTNATPVPTAVLTSGQFDMALERF